MVFWFNEDALPLHTFQVFLASDWFTEGENNDELICETTEVEILPSIDFGKFIMFLWCNFLGITYIYGRLVPMASWRSTGYQTPAIHTFKVPDLVKFLSERTVFVAMAWLCDPNSWRDETNSDHLPLQAHGWGKAEYNSTPCPCPS